MRAFSTRGDGIAALTLHERPAPQPAPGEVLVRLRAAALNYRDLLVVGGVGGWKPPEPRVPVSDGVGVVTAVGDGVARVGIGDRVAGIFLPRWIDGELTTERSVASLGGAAADGVMTEARTFDAEAVVRVPEHLTDAEAATLPVAALTAWHAIQRCGVQPGDTVLVQGTGGVSLMAAQLAQALGARPIVTSRSDAKLARVRALLGDLPTVDTGRTPAWDAEVLRLTDGRGVDHVIEVVGGENLNRSLEAVRVSGTIAFIGLLAGMRAPIDTFQFVRKNVRLHGIETGSRAMFEAMNGFLAEHPLRPVIDRTFPFDGFPDALRYVESGSHFGKVVVSL